MENITPPNPKYMQIQQIFLIPKYMSDNTNTMLSVIL